MKLRHFDHDGRARFITFGLHHRVPLLTNDPLRQIIADCINDARISYGFRLLGYVIMPEHVHLVLVPRIDDRASRIIGDIKRESALRVHEVLKMNDSRLLDTFRVRRNGVERFALWQRRCFDHNCRTDDAVWGRVQYCHNNPVLRGLVDTPEKWRWSSNGWYHGERRVPLLIDVD